MLGDQDIEFGGSLEGVLIPANYHLQKFRYFQIEVLLQCRTHQTSLQRAGARAFRQVTRLCYPSETVIYLDLAFFLLLCDLSKELFLSMGWRNRFHPPTRGNTWRSPVSLLTYCFNVNYLFMYQSRKL